MGPPIWSPPYGPPHMGPLTKKKTAPPGGGGCLRSSGHLWPPLSVSGDLQNSSLFFVGLGFDKNSVANFWFPVLIQEIFVKSNWTVHNSIVFDRHVWVF